MRIVKQLDLDFIHCIGQIGHSLGAHTCHLICVNFRICSSIAASCVNLINSSQNTRSTSCSMSSFLFFVSLSSSSSVLSLMDMKISQQKGCIPFHLKSLFFLQSVLNDEHLPEIHLVAVYQVKQQVPYGIEWQCSVDLKKGQITRRTRSGEAFYKYIKKTDQIKGYFFSFHYQRNNIEMIPKHP